MFLGEYEHNLDQKGRMAVPAKFRNKLEGGAIITRGLDKCLFLYPQKEWEVFANKIVSLPVSQSGSRAFSRLMLSGASDVEFDQQGRILIPETLRKYAGISKAVVITGLYNRIEIWDEKSWNIYRKKTENEADEVAEKMGEMGI